MTNSIELLPEHIIDQIKAGEVIERPSTLVKELLENSIDANATAIKIHIINSGLDLIHIEDNGNGISFEDLPLAFCRHATSKISNFEDIYSLNTYGFRGEALASIASVSKVTCVTNNKKTPLSTIKFEGGLQTLLEQETLAQKESKTLFFIKDLFFNTPVRMKFIQSKQSEKNQLKRIINAFILTHPNIQFDVTWDEESKIRYHRVNASEMTKRVKDLFEKRTNPLELLELENSYDGFKAKIILSKNSHKGNAGKFHYLFINDRIVQDIQIHKIILNSAKELWQNGETGNYCAFIYAPSDQIDVNVHPNKTVVKIFQAPKLYSLISSAIKNIIFELKREKRVPEYQENFALNETRISPINYKEQDFDESYDIQTYFHELDGVKASQTRSSKVIYQTNLFTFFVNEKDTLLIKNDLFTFTLMNQIMQSPNKESSALLISEPFKVKKGKDDQAIFALIDQGFEFDRLDESTLVLRSFPLVLSDYPYSKYAELLIKNIQGEFSKKIAYIPKGFQIEYALDKIGVSKLIELNCIKAIKDKDLEKLFK